MNAASLKAKLFSFENLILDYEPSVFGIQETHFQKKGQIKFQSSDKYQIYELTRERRGGDGLALGVKKCLNPIWLKSGNDQCEALTVQISMENLDIRITNAYGPQNYDDGHKKVEFWAYLENEVNISNQSNVGCIIMFDANSWLGYDYLCSDPNPQNENGKIFEDFLERNKNMTLLNSHPSCQGFITRSRIVKNKEEWSIIDFILICDKILPYFQNMMIDEEKT